VPLTLDKIIDSETVTATVNHWMDAMVVGLNLCPFANTVRRQGHLNIAVAQDGSIPGCLQLLADEAHELAERDASATSLVILPEGFEDFDDYLDLLAMAEALLEDLGFEGAMQLASFHPRYQFEGTDENDVSNWTNRAPYPILHMLQESAVTKAVEAHPNAEGIPEQNIDTLEKLGMAGVLQLLRY